MSAPPFALPLVLIHTGADHGLAISLMAGLMPRISFKIGIRCCLSGDSENFKSFSSVSPSGRSSYEKTFVSSIEKDNITGVQFHPEKSHKAGEQLIKNFLTK